MALQSLGKIIIIVLMSQQTLEEFNVMQSDQSEYDDQITWMLRHNKVQEERPDCGDVQPTGKDIVRRFYAIVPYLDKDHANAAFLHKYRAAIYSMSEGEDLLDREVAFYATIITPIVFLQQYKDTWCLMERFHRALRLFQISHPTDKRQAMKILQSIRVVNNKVLSLITEVSAPAAPTRYYSTTQEEEDFNEVNNKDVKYLKELIKNLG